MLIRGKRYMRNLLLAKPVKKAMKQQMHSRMINLFLYQHRKWSAKICGYLNLHLLMEKTREHRYHVSLQKARCYSRDICIILPF